MPYILRKERRNPVTWCKKTKYNKLERTLEKVKRITWKEGFERGLTRVSKDREKKGGGVLFLFKAQLSYSHILHIWMLVMIVKLLHFTA